MKKTTLTKAAAITCMALITALPAKAAEDTTGGSMNSPAATAFYLKGKVLDDTGEPLTGAVVKIKGTDTGVLTDLNGNFSIPVTKQGRYTLNITFVGMTALETAATTTKAIVVKMEADSKVLDEVVVSGFQTISRERNTGSAVIVNSEKLSKIQATTLSSKLEGMTPGLTIYNGDMSIRGTSSFAVSGTPLLVIDGQPATGISIDNINPEIIDQVTVLKDAAATSLYGVRASNGVIVITTKNAAKDKLDINVSANYYLKPLPSLSYKHYASTSDIIDLEEEFLLSDPDYQANPLAYFNTLTNKSNATFMTQVDMIYYRLAKGEIDQAGAKSAIDALRNYDYRKEYRDKLQQMAITQDYSVSVSKGGDKYNFFASGRLRSNGMYTKFNDNNTAQLYLKNDLQVAPWFKLTLGADLSVLKSKYTQASYLGYANAMPYDRLYNDDGSLAYRYPYNQVLAESFDNAQGLQPMGYNAVEESGNNIAKTDNTYIKYFAQTDFKIVKGLGLELKFQYEKRMIDQEEYDEADSYMMRSLVNEFTSTNTDGTYTYNIPQGGRLYSVSANYSYYNLRGQFNYNTTIASKHDITALLGGEIREDNYRSWSSERFGYDDQKLTYSQVDWQTLSRDGVVGQLYSSVRRRAENLSVSEIKHRYVSAYFNAGYTYDQRYAFNASVRIEQADLFGTDPKYRYRPLWSAGASWNANKEEFMKQFSWINLLKLRLTYGITGNVDQSSSPYLLAGFATTLHSGAPVTMILTPPNSSLRWEKTSTFNVGIDYRFLGKLSGSIDFYRRYSSDLLVNKSIDPSLGFNGMAKANNGEMKNVGVEFVATYDWLKHKQTSLSTTFSVAYNSNTIEKVDYDPTDAIDMIQSPASNYRVGDTYKSVYAYHYAGLTSDGNPSVYDENGNIVSISPVRSADAVVCVGQLTPKWSGALSMDFRYKNLGVFLKAVYYTGHSLRDDVVTLYDSYNTIRNGAIGEDIVNRWTPTNTDTDIPAMGLHSDTGERNYHWKYADVNVVSASFIKMRNIGVTYDLPKTWLTKTGVKGARLKLQVDNAFRWTANDKDIDPEAFNANSGTRNEAVMPSYILGLNIQF